MPLILGTNSIKDTGFNVANSLRFNNDSSDNLSRTPSSTSNRRTFTFSTWFKLSGTDGALISAGTDISNGPLFIIDMLSGSNIGTLRVEDTVGGNNVINLRPTRKLRDTSWYHLCVAIDTTQGTASNRVKLYINGTQETSFGTADYPNQNLELSMNQNHITRIGTRATSPSGKYFDGYMCETVLVDGSQLAPDQFGEFDSDSGIWKPIDVSGLTFGTNGFYLDFENSGSLGADVSGNSNNFTVNNLTSIDQSTDTCTNNFNIFMSHTTSSYTTLSDGGLVLFGNNSGDTGNSLGSFGVTSGKWYYEIKLTVANSGYPLHGWVKTSDVEYGHQGANGGSGDPTPRIYGFSTSNTYNGSSAVSNVSFSQGETIGMALDLENGALYVSQNGTFINSSNPESGASKTNAQITWTPAGETYSTYCASYNGSKGEFNFGSPAHSISSGNTDGNGYGNMEFAVPSGYYILNSKNLAEFG